jgi:hypothetical protein
MKKLETIHNGTLYEGFRLYEGEADRKHPRDFMAQRRYGVTIAICSEVTKTHSVWVVMDNEHTIRNFTNFLSLVFPKVTYTRYLRSRT